VSHRHTSNHKERNKIVAPTIRIDDEVFAKLQEKAEPLVDSPNSVLRRLLDLAQPNGSAPVSGEDAVGESPGTPAPASTGGVGGMKKVKLPKQRRAARGTLLPQGEYELPLLQVLFEAGGRAPSREAIDAIEPKLAGKFTEVDRGELPSGELRWRNRTAFARLALVESGDIKKDSPRGIWELTENGAERAKGGAR
jgi:Mrr N-terminal domain